MQDNNETTGFFAPLAQDDAGTNAGQPGRVALPPHNDAFTLAEVLITLGIIGIVAAMTLPTLIKKYTNHVVETRLKVFYSQVNEAIRLSEAEYGDKKDWFNRLDDSEGYSYTDRDEWFQKYIGKHIKIVKKELSVPFLTNGGGNIYYLSNGSAFGNYQSNNSDWVFFPGNPQKCLKLSNSTSYVSHVGKCAFVFNFSPNSKNPNWQFTYNKGVEPWKYGWDGEESTLKTGCATGTGTSTRGYYCAALIQYNNWTIPKDYPHQVSY